MNKLNNTDNSNNISEYDEYNKVLYDKEGFRFIKICKNNYKLYFSMENKKIILKNIINFDFLKLIYDLNPDIYEKVKLDKLNEEEAYIVLVLKNLFEDLGLPQRFNYVHVHKIVDKETNSVIFNAKTIKNVRPDIVPQDAQLLDLQDMSIICDSVTDNKINFYVNILFEDYVVVPNFAEKVIGLIVNKIFKRVKQFIENIRI